MSTIKSLFVSGLLLVSLNGSAQSEIKEEPCVILLDSFGNGGNYSNVDSMPHFPGGQEAMMKFITTHLQIPEDFISWNSKVITQFVVDTNGYLTDKKIIKGLNDDLNKAVLDVLDKMPPWVPGKCHGRLVPVVFTLPVIIELQ
jgi:protein TonB